MADPFTISIVSLAMASAAMSIGGGITSQQAGKAQAKALRRTGEAEADDIRRRTRRLAATQRAAFGASGVDPNVGSPIDVLGDTIAEGELAALRARATRRGQGTAAKSQGSQAFISGISGGATSILGGVTAAKALGD